MDVGERTAAQSPVPEDKADALRVLVERHYQHMYRLAFRMTGNQEDAKDVVQESWVRAYQRLNQFQGRAAVGTWLHRIVVNCAVDLMRASRSRPDVGQPAPIDERALGIRHPSPDPEQLTAGAETGRRIAAGMNALTPIERAAFVLRHFEGCTIEEISETLGLRGNNVKQQIFRAIRKMRVVLEPERSHR